MLNRFALLPVLLLFSLTSTGCDFVGDVLEFGFWLVIIVLGLIALVIWLIYRAIRGKRNP